MNDSHPTFGKHVIITEDVKYIGEDTPSSKEETFQEIKEIYKCLILSNQEKS